MTEPPHVIQPPPQNNPTIARIAQVLALATTAEAAIAGIEVILRPFHLHPDAIAMAVRLTDRGTNHQPRPRGYHEIARRQARTETYLRAAYVIRAAGRINRDLVDGLELPAAGAREARYQQAHEKARRQRQDAVRRVIDEANQWGDLLGWYLNPFLNNERECRAANGNNFDPIEGTIIGYPGTVHAGCGCYPGAPWPDGGLVDVAVRPHVRYGQARPLTPLRRRGVR